MQISDQYLPNNNVLALSRNTLLVPNASVPLDGWHYMPVYVVHEKHKRNLSWFANDSEQNEIPTRMEEWY